MKLLSIAAAVFTVTPCFVFASASALDGTWHVAGSVQDNPVNPVCVMVEKDGKLSGTCTGTDGKPVPLTGTVKEKEIKWQYDTAYEGNGITIFFTGKMDKDDHLSGSIYVEPYAVDGGFTATRDKPTTPVPAPAPATS